MKTSVTTYMGESIKASQEGGTVVLTLPLQQARGLANQCRSWYSQAKQGNSDWQGSNSPQGLVLDTLLGIITKDAGDEQGITLYDAPAVTPYTSPARPQEAVAPRISKKAARKSLKVGFKYKDGNDVWHEVVREREQPTLGYGYEARCSVTNSVYSFTSQGWFLVNRPEGDTNLILSTAKRVKGGV